MIGLSRNLEQMLRPKVPVNPDPFFQDSDFMRKSNYLPTYCWKATELFVIFSFNAKKHHQGRVKQLLSTYEEWLQTRTKLWWLTKMEILSTHSKQRKKCTKKSARITKNFTFGLNFPELAHHQLWKSKVYKGWREFLRVKNSTISSAKSQVSVKNRQISRKIVTKFYLKVVKFHKKMVTKLHA